MMAKIENDENLTQFSRRNLKKLGQSFQDEKTLMSMRESRDTQPLRSTYSASMNPPNDTEHYSPKIQGKCVALATGFYFILSQ